MDKAITTINEPQEEWYKALIEECKAIITESVFTSRWALVEGYHQLGERIVTDEQFQKYAKGSYSSLTRVSKNLRLSYRTLYRAIQFYEKYPDLSLVPEGKNITWRKIITKYLPESSEPNQEKIKVDKLAELRNKWGTELGQTWILGNHRLICGDVYDSAHYITAIRFEDVDALITDPPYGISYKPDWNKWDASPSEFKPVTGDNKEFDPFPFLPFPTVVLFGANYFSNKLPIGGWICWDKRLDESKDSMFGSPFELAWYRSINTTKKTIMIRVLHGGVVNANSTIGNNEKRLHPTEKPVQVMEHILESLTNPGDIVLDPFAGSGSTLIACENKGRMCLAIEIEPDYVALILERWIKKTGIKPTKED